MHVTVMKVITDELWRGVPSKSLYGDNVMLMADSEQSTSSGVHTTVSSCGKMFRCGTSA